MGIHGYNNWEIKIIMLIIFNKIRPSYQPESGENET